MRLNKFSAYTTAALLSQLKDIEAVRNSRREKRAEDNRNRAALEALIRKLGITPAAAARLLGFRPNANATVLPIKYRNPYNSQETWTGHARMPQWLTALCAEYGTCREDYEV